MKTDILIFCQFIITMILVVTCVLVGIVQQDKCQLGKIQQNLTTLLYEFDRLAEEHRITYFIIFGTLLGMVGMFSGALYHFYYAPPF